MAVFPAVAHDVAPSPTVVFPSVHRSYCPPQEIPCIADGDTGYGNAVNVKRTVKGYAQVRGCTVLYVTWCATLAAIVYQRRRRGGGEDVRDGRIYES
jgi:hypothetical protein